jgi:hypothetical protein
MTNNTKNQSFFNKKVADFLAKVFNCFLAEKNRENQPYMGGKTL